MNNDRELIHAALQWHATHSHRRAIGAEKRRLDNQVKEEWGDGPLSRARLRQGDVARQLTEARR